MDLQDASRRSRMLNSGNESDGAQSSESTESMSLNFARIVGSLAASIPPSEAATVPDSDLELSHRHMRDDDDGDLGEIWW